MVAIRYFKCPIKTCKTTTGFDINKVGVAGESTLVCSGCKRKWEVTILPSCCKLELLFVSFQSGSKKSLRWQQSFPK